MTRSSGIPRRRALQGMTRIIGGRTQRVTVERVSETKGSLDETQTTTDEHIEDIWLYQPRESVATELAGERIDGSLGGLVISDGRVDIQHNDRITHGGVEYEVDTIVGKPSDGSPDGAPSPDTDFWIISFVRRQ